MYLRNRCIYHDTIPFDSMMNVISMQAFLFEYKVSRVSLTFMLHPFLTHCVYCIQVRVILQTGPFNIQGKDPFSVPEVFSYIFPASVTIDQVSSYVLSTSFTFLFLPFIRSYFLHPPPFLCSFRGTSWTRFCNYQKSSAREFLASWW